MKADKEGTKAIIGKYTKSHRPGGTRSGRTKITLRYLLDVPYADPAGMKTLLDDMAPKNPKAAAADPKSFVDAELRAGNGSVGVHQAAVEEVRE